MLKIVPINFKDANAYVAKHHRHHKPVIGMKFCLAVSDGEQIRGVALIGRPVSRMLDNGFVLEINRVCTDGCKNANSMLYRASWRVAKELGYLKLITYTLPEEGGASLRGAGFKLVGRRGGGEWSRPSRVRKAVEVSKEKLLWEVQCNYTFPIREFVRNQNAALAAQEEKK